MSGNESQTPNAGPTDARRRRAASVTLREGSGSARSAGDPLDPANKSLADALRIAYRLLQVLITLMLVAFIWSGVKEIGAAEVGVRTTLGAIDQRDLRPGWRFSWPAPIGDILLVQTNEQNIELKKEFFPNLSTPEEQQLVDKGAQGLEGGQDSLDPDNGGALLTADGSLVHTRWLVTYRRSNSSLSLERIVRDSDGGDEYAVERQIVLAAARRGIVHAAAKLTIDEMLSDQPGPGREGVFRAAKEIAKDETQKMLDAMDLGITIQVFEKKAKMPPRFLIKDFAAVETAQANANKVREDALSDARQKLTRTAGEGAGVILERIDRYGAQLTTGKTEEAGATLRTIEDLMLRKPVVIDGKPVGPVVSGEVSRTLIEADQYRTSVVSRAQGEASAYSAKLHAFRAAPQVFLTREWTDAYAAFSKRQTLQTLLMPPGLERMVVQINKDPSIAKMIEDEIAKQEAERNRLDIIRRRQRELFIQQFRGTGNEGV